MIECQEHESTADRGEGGARRRLNKDHSCLLYCSFVHIECCPMFHSDCLVFFFVRVLGVVLRACFLSLCRSMDCSCSTYILFVFAVLCVVRAEYYHRRDQRTVLLSLQSSRCLSFLSFFFFSFFFFLNGLVILLYVVLFFCYTASHLFCGWTRW